MSRVRWAVVVLAILIAVYVGTYFALLDTTASPTVWIGPKFRSESQTLRAVFAPLMWIDYKLRPDYWNSRLFLIQF
jgi:hypothetical protein